MATGRHFQKLLYYNLGQESANSDGIWYLYADTNFDSDDDHMTKKLKILQI